MDRMIIGYVKIGNDEESEKKKIKEPKNGTPLVVSIDANDWHGLLFEGTMDYKMFKEKYKPIVEDIRRGHYVEIMPNIYF